MAAKNRYERTKGSERASKANLVCSIGIFGTEYKSVEDALISIFLKERGLQPSFPSLYRWAYPYIKTLEIHIISFTIDT
jgi:hypothetical protein